ncbi:CRPV-076 [Crowpox virus]|nr:CRPV-076 [Crowpox virus]
MLMFSYCNYVLCLVYFRFLYNYIIHLLSNDMFVWF